MNKEDDESVSEGLVNICVQKKGTPFLLLRQDSKSKVQWIQNSKEDTGELGEGLGSTPGSLRPHSVSLTIYTNSWNAVFSSLKEELGQISKNLDHPKIQ